MEAPFCNQPAALPTWRPPSVILPRAFTSMQPQKGGRKQTCSCTAPGGRVTWEVRGGWVKLSADGALLPASWSQSCASTLEGRPRELGVSLPVLRGGAPSPAKLPGRHHPWGGTREKVSKRESVTCHPLGASWALPGSFEGWSPGGVEAAGGSHVEGEGVAGSAGAGRRGCFAAGSEPWLCHQSISLIQPPPARGECAGNLTFLNQGINKYLDQHVNK